MTLSGANQMETEIFNIQNQLREDPAAFSELLTGHHEMKHLDSHEHEDYLALMTRLAGSRSQEPLEWSPGLSMAAKELCDY
jgi:hypothetical protein